jgi:hypothetical protein
MWKKGCQDVEIFRCYKVRATEEGSDMRGSRPARWSDANQIQPLKSLGAASVLRTVFSVVSLEQQPTGKSSSEQNPSYAD